MEDKNTNEEFSEAINSQEKEKKSVFSNFSFWKSKKEENKTPPASFPPQMSGIEGELEENSKDFWNIFDEFENEQSSFKEEKEEKKDIYFYLNTFWNIFKYLFILLLIVSSISFAYTYIQKSETFSSSLLDPVCNIFLWSIKEIPCKSINKYKITLNEELNGVKNDQFIKSKWIIEKVYEIENFSETKDVYFLTEKSNNKLQTIKILDEFDKLKNEFDTVDKKRIVCGWISIDSQKNTLEISCTAYSAWFERWMLWFDWKSSKIIEWTSISIANSFLNYISKIENPIFTIIDRQKIFSSESVVWDNSWYTNATKFSLKLKYNLK